MLTARAQAIKDIKEDFGKCFLSFHSELNKPIRAIVEEQLKLQKKLK